MRHAVRSLARQVAAATLLAAAWAAPLRAHHGPPVELVRAQRHGPYTVSLWATQDVGAGPVYVGLVPTPGVPFVPPQSVRVAVRPSTGTGSAAQYVAVPEAVRHGARFVATITTPHAGLWQVQVQLAGPAGTAALESRFATADVGSLGVPGVLFYAAPFVLVAGLWVRARLMRARQPMRPVSLSSP